MSSPALDVVVVGELLLELRGDVEAASTLDVACGGAAYVTAEALVARGCGAGLAAMIADDAVGRALARRVERGGVEIVVRGKATSRADLAFVLPRGFVGYRARTPLAAAREFSTRLTAAIEARRPKHVHLASCPAFQGDRVIARAAIAAGRAVGATLSMDANARPTIFRDARAKPLAALGIAAKVDFLKASDEDLGVLGVSDTEVAKLVARSNPSSAFTVTRGANGASLYVGGRDAIHVCAPSPTTARFIGAGDRFVASLVHDLLRMPLASPSEWLDALARAQSSAVAVPA